MKLAHLFSFGVTQVCSTDAVQTLTISVQDMRPHTALSVDMFSTVATLGTLLFWPTTLFCR